MPDLEKLIPAVERLIADSEKLSDDINAAIDPVSGQQLYAERALKTASSNQAMAHRHLRAAAESLQQLREKQPA